VYRPSNEPCLITPDSGTSLITTPSWAYEYLSGLLPQVEGCQSQYVFGTLTFVINGKDYDIPSHHFMELYTDVYQPGDKVCMTSISSLDIMQDGQANLFIVGDAFMQLFYTIFNRDDNTVGLAKSRIYKDEKELSSVDYGLIASNIGNTRID
jgi:Eukaryotic aspartyl protease